MKSKIAILTACFATLLTTSALADYDTLGRVDVGQRPDRDRMTFNLAGPIDRLQLRADRNDVNCNSVNATFDNGRTRRIYSGRLNENRTVNVDLPGRERFIRRLDFDCRTMGRRDASISVIADVGNNNRSAWMRSPDWQRQWANVFNWGSNAINDWRLIGSESFEGRNDHETSNVGVRGMRVDAIALKPLETDARCSQIGVRFDNGQTRILTLRNRDLLRRGQYEKLDLPGDTRNLARLDMRCRAVDGRRVTIQVFTSKG